MAFTSIKEILNLVVLIVAIAYILSGYIRSPKKSLLKLRRKTLFDSYCVPCPREQFSRILSLQRLRSAGDAGDRDLLEQKPSTTPLAPTHVERQFFYDEYVQLKKNREISCAIPYARMVQFALLSEKT